MSASPLRRFFHPDKNVGGGDFATRLIAIVWLLALTLTILTVDRSNLSMTRIAALGTAEVGLVGLMLGMFLRSKTYLSGLQLFLGGLLAYALVLHGSSAGAVAVCVALMLGGVMPLVSRRSHINGLLGLNSYVPPKPAEPTLLEAALSLEPPAPLSPPPAAREPG